MGAILTNPMHVVSRLRENNVRCLTDDEERRLIEALPERLRRLVAVAIRTGMRKGELLDLRWADVDWAMNTIAVRKAKSGEGWRLPLKQRNAPGATWAK